MVRSNFHLPDLIWWPFLAEAWAWDIEDRIPWVPESLLRRATSCSASPPRGPASSAPARAASGMRAAASSAGIAADCRWNWGNKNWIKNLVNTLNGIMNNIIKFILTWQRSLITINIIKFNNIISSGSFSKSGFLKLVSFNGKLSFVNYSVIFVRNSLALNDPF